MNIKLILKGLGFITPIILFLTAILGYQTATKNAENFLKQKGTIGEMLTDVVEKNNKNLIKQRDSNELFLDLVPFIETEIKDLDLRLKFGLKGTNPSGGIEIAGYRPGSYCLAEYNSIMALLNIMNTIITRFCKENMDDSSMLETEIIGFADGLRVKKDATYKGDLGEIVEFEYYSINSSEKKSISFVAGKTKMINEDFAALRAYDIQEYLKRLEPFKNNSRFEISTKTTEQIGPQFRKVIIEITLKNAFLKKYNELNFLEKKIYTKNFKNK